MAKIFLPENHHSSELKFLIPRKYEFEIEMDAVNITLCRDSLLNVCGQGLGVWKDILKCLKNNSTIPVHGMKGKTNKTMLKEGSIDLEYATDHYLSLEGTAEVRATCLVREIANEITTRDDDEKALFLPSCTSIRSCYAMYCSGLGYLVSTTYKGTKPIENADYNGEHRYCMSY